ncbi:hypothetical protein N8T08_008011 [Aspergillus melleus]|uniref:Uncharacterized protein n=1 Tax=Aspergillus melleus TaxID=138277 RepID=A0ACC3AWH0_9EURO|nr:hypothetical protein N8T08_008011 [Aspergillus melleus]
MRITTFLSVVYLFLGLVSASSNGLDLGHGALVPRADETTTAADKATTGAAATTEKTATKTATDDATSTGTKTGKETDKETGTATGKETGKETGKTGKETGTKTGKASKTKDDKKTTSTSIDPRSPAGGVKMLTPSTGASSYYKIGEHVTFVWNYTSLLVTPSAVNVIASCSLNSATYTISSNMSVEETGKVVWDTKKYQANATVPLLTATYTLVIYDADTEIGDTAGPGHLSSQNQLNFGMYVPQSYTPLNEYHCVTCSGALSDMERQALKFAVGMVLITVASFTWFAGDFGVFST